MSSLATLPALCREPHSASVSSSVKWSCDCAPQYICVRASVCRSTCMKVQLSSLIRAKAPPGSGCLACPPQASGLPSSLSHSSKLLNSTSPQTWGQGAAPSPNSSWEGFRGPAHKRRFPAAPRSPAVPPRRLHHQSMQRMSRAAPGRLLQLGVFPQIWSLSAVTGGLGVGSPAGFLLAGWGGALGEPAGEADITAARPFKPLTQPAPVLSAPAQTQHLTPSCEPRGSSVSAFVLGMEGSGS